MSSFNAIGNTNKEYGGNTPIWHGKYSTFPVGGVLASAFLKKGLLIPAGTPAKLDSGTITPLLAFEVVAYTAGTLQIKPCLGYVPTTSDFIMKLGTNFSSTGKASAISAVAENATTPGTYDLTVTDANLDSLAAGDVCVLSSAVAGGASKSVKTIPNGYTLNDISLDNLSDGANDNLGATGAVVYAGFIYVNRNPIASLVKSRMKVVVPNVEQDNR